MFGLGMTELVLIIAIGLLLFGANRLPEIGAGVGRGIRGLREGLTSETRNGESDEDRDGDDRSSQGSESSDAK